LTKLTTKQVIKLRNLGMLQPVNKEPIDPKPKRDASETPKRPSENSYNEPIPIVPIIYRTNPQRQISPVAQVQKRTKAIERKLF
jgi:hypothetical protein